MSNTKGTGNKRNEGILTRETTYRNPDLKKQINEINKEANVFGRKPRVQRTPPSINLEKNLEHTYVNVPYLTQKQEKIRKKLQFQRLQKQILTYQKNQIHQLQLT